MKNQFNIKVKNFFLKNFSFESGVNLNDECEVLYKRNVVIKNIIFVSNILYSIILFLVSFGSSNAVNWLWFILPFPMTLGFNWLIKRIINKGRKIIYYQRTGMYVSSALCILSAFLVYLKLTLSGINYADASYLLFFYSLVVISFYQDPKMLFPTYFIFFLGMIVVHLTLTHNFFEVASSSENIFKFVLVDLWNNDVAIDYIRDIFFRTIILVIFMAALLIIADISHKMSEERTNELTKRKDIQDDFTNVVTDLYNVLLETNVGFDDNDTLTPLLAEMSKKLASFYGLSNDKCQEIYDYAIFNHVNKMNLTMDENSEKRFEELREQTSLGATIAKRMQLSQKGENIIRAHLEGWANQDFTVKMLNMQNTLESDIVLLCELYMNLRSYKSYKRPYPHKMAIEALEQEFKIYFKDDLFDRFIKFSKDFEDMYNEFQM